MKKFILSFVLTIGLSALSLANNNVKSEILPRLFICTIETDTDDGGCCTQVGTSTVSVTEACKNAANDKCATISN